MANFLLPPDVGGDASLYVVDNKVAPGSVSEMRVPRLRSLNIGLYGGAGLWVRSNNTKVVPQWRESEEIIRGDVRILPIFGCDLGGTTIEAGLGPLTWISLKVEVIDRKVRHIALERPTMVVYGNSIPALPLTHPYKLVYETTISPQASAQQMIDEIKAHLPLNHLVLNSHGISGFLDIGIGITPKDALLFSQLTQQTGAQRTARIGVIWIRGCSFAGDPDPSGRGANGDQFCKEIVRQSLSYVVAPYMHTPQYLGLPPGMLEYEQNMPRVYTPPNGDRIDFAGFCCRYHQSLHFSFPFVAMGR